ncbi:MAG: S26 family signal peptidase [Gemmata sp.]
MDHTDTPPPEVLDLPPEEPPAPGGRAPAPRPRTNAPVHNVSSLRAALVVMTGFLGLFLVVRTVAVEPFGVPTGSMSPALSGHHRDGPCPRCGYTVRVGRPTSGNLAEFFRKVTCPNCDSGLSLADARDLSGDRLLVDKNVFSLRGPRRWEMIVFRCPNPNDEFGKPYVKRLVGLPGETVTIVDGDIYANGEIARKDLAAMRETLVPVFDMNHSPHNGGWDSRWLIETAGDPRLPAGAVPDAPANAPAVVGAELVLDASDTAQTTAALRYRHWHIDDRKEAPVRAWNSYDGSPRRSDLPLAQDFYLRCEVEVTSAVGAPGEANFECRLYDGLDKVAAELTVGPKKDGRARLVRENHGGLASAAGVSLEVGKKYALEFAFIDRCAVLALDGRVAVGPADLEAAVKRGPEPRPVRVAARGCRVVVRNLQLFRDVHYTADATDYHGVRAPAVLKAGEFFVLGDNSGNSEDSRKWPTPAVPEGSLIGKPFLIHQPLKLGRVSVGGRERAFQTLDWSRLRWVH